MHVLMFLCVSMAVYMRQSRYRSQRINLGYLSLSSTLIESVSLLFAWHFWGFFCLYISSCVGTLRLQTILGIVMPSSTWVVGIGIYILTLAWQAFYPMCQHPHTLFPTWLQSFLSPVFPRLPILVIFLILLMGARLCVFTANTGTWNPNCYLRDKLSLLFTQI